MWATEKHTEGGGPKEFATSRLAVRCRAQFVDYIALPLTSALVGRDRLKNVHLELSVRIVSLWTCGRRLFRPVYK